MDGHPIFREAIFSDVYGGPFSPDLWFDFLGTANRLAWFTIGTMEAQSVAILPGLDEEYFEWCALLQSVRAARERYVMVELGAGFGRWGIRAAAAARRCGI